MGSPVPPKSIGATIIAEEERLFGQVEARVALGDEDDGRPTVGNTEIDRDLLSLRDQISEARVEDLPPLIEQMTRLAALKGRLGGSRTLPVDLNSPYFAHIRLREHDKRRDVLIGKRGFIDRSSNVQIVDWRNAPVSRIYYRYEEGDDYEEEIAGRRIDGVVECRRNVSIAKGHLRRIGAPQGTFIRDARGTWHEAVGRLAPVLHGGQGKAARPVVKPGEKGKLGVHHGPQIRADKALPEIAALIDREQFDLISQPGSGIVLIQGGAGSGKTTVALHRVAFLNFHEPGRFRPSAMLFVVPSKALVRYVQGVLPSLGVTGVPVVTYAGWARSTRLRCLPDSPIRYNDDPPEEVARVKKHPALLAAVEEHVVRQTQTIGNELAAVAGDHTDAVIAEWNRHVGRALLPRLAKLAAWTRKADLAVPVRIGLEGLVRRWRERGDDVLADWAELLTDPVVLREAFAPAIAAGDLTGRDLDRAIAWVRRQTAPPVQQPTDDEGTPIESADGAPVEDESDPGGKMDDEDDPILLRLVQLKRGGLQAPSGDELRYQHVAIDEAQDRSVIEVKVLVEAVVAPERVAADRSVTIAGDTAQRLVFDNAFRGWADLLERTGIAGGKGAAVVRPLRLSYRSTAEVMLLAREILGPELAPEEPLAARPGEPVELHEFSDIGEAVAFLGDALRNLMAREPTASAAVISRHPEQADAYYDGLSRAEVPGLRRVRRDEFLFQPGVDVTDVANVKGLEFDYVVMVDVNAQSYPDVPWARHLLHIGVTRAAHQLWLVSTAEPSPLVPAALRDGGRMGVG